MSDWIKRHRLAAYFVLAYAISWAFQIPLAVSAQGLIKAQIPYAIHYLASFGPLSAALIVTSVSEGREGLRRLLGGLTKWCVGWGYYVFSVLAPAALFGLAVIASRLMQGAWPDLSLLGRADYLPYLCPAGALGLWVLTFGLGEETGWRGFALPHLQRDRTAGSASMLLGILWALWHLPAFFYRDTFIQMGALGFPMFALSILLVSVVFAWLYNSTGGSLLLAILFHGVFNWLSTSDAGGSGAATLMSIPVVLWAVYVLWRYKPATLSPAEKQIA